MVKMSVCQKTRRIGGIFTATLTALVSLVGCAQISETRELEHGHYQIDGNVVIISLDKVPELSQVGSSVNLADEILAYPIIIARVDKDKFIAASNQCTHKGKPLAYNHKDGLFKCSGGRGRFNLDGTVVGGPPEKSLIIYATAFKGDSLEIDLNY
jgi:Rieske Fe-S protein